MKPKKHLCVQTSDCFHVLYVRQHIVGIFGYWCKVKDLPYNHDEVLRITAALMDVKFKDNRKLKNN